MAALAAGWPDEVTGVSLNRFCGSGQQAVNFAAMGVLAGHQDLVVGGGIESMSRPTSLHVDGFSANNPHLFEQYAMVPQGISADLIATRGGFTREQCDQLAVDSQARAAEAIAEGRFERSLVPISDDDGNVVLATEEFPRPGTTLEGLAKLFPSFEKMGAYEDPRSGRTVDQTALLAYPAFDHIEHVHHAGNSSGIVDGAALVVVGSEQVGRDLGLTPRARIVAGAPPRRLGFLRKESECI